MCPVQSDKTLCCNLRTIDAVKNCGFGCSYCSIQTMHEGNNIQFDEDFGTKLDSIELDPEKGYHIGTGQSSDALMWGNKNGILDDMFRFARKWPNAVLEFKTKSRNIDHFLRSDVPANVICSWSLNPDVIVKNEEHLTADLGQRLNAARRVSNKGIAIAFHLHPMVYYEGWQAGYSSLIERVTENFDYDEVAFVSFGALTFPKPIVRKIRSSGIKTKIHQISMSPNPEGKMTYPDHIKEELFGHAYRAFSMPGTARCFSTSAWRNQNSGKRLSVNDSPTTKHSNRLCWTAPVPSLFLKKRILESPAIVQVPEHGAQRLDTALPVSVQIPDLAGPMQGIVQLPGQPFRRKQFVDPAPVALHTQGQVWVDEVLTTGLAQKSLRFVGALPIDLVFRQDRGDVSALLAPCWNDGFREVVKDHCKT